MTKDDLVENPYGMKQQATLWVKEQMSNTDGEYKPHVVSDNEEKIPEAAYVDGMNEYWRRVEVHNPSSEEPIQPVLVAYPMSKEAYMELFVEDEGPLASANIKYLYFPNVEYKEESGGALFITYMPSLQHCNVDGEFMTQAGNWRLQYAEYIGAYPNGEGSNRAVNSKVCPDFRFIPLKKKRDHHDKDGDKDEDFSKPTGITRFYFEIENANRNPVELRAHGYKLMKKNERVRGFLGGKMKQYDDNTFAICVVYWRKNDQHDIVVEKAISFGSKHLDRNLLANFSKSQKEHDDDLGANDQARVDLLPAVNPEDWERPANAKNAQFKPSAYPFSDFVDQWKLSLPFADIMYKVSNGNAAYVTDVLEPADKHDLVVDLWKLACGVFEILEEEDSSTSTDAAPTATLSQSDDSYAGIRTRSQTKSMKRADAPPGSSSKTSKRKKRTR